VLRFPNPSKETLVKTTASIIVLAFCFALAACNTVKGVGQDIQKAGEKLEDAAKKK
jgi:predicted small secreted protein